MKTIRRTKFYRWLMKYKRDDTPFGDLARDADQDFNGNSCWPGRGPWNGSLSDLKTILEEYGSPEAQETMHEVARCFNCREVRP